MPTFSIDIPKETPDKHLYDDSCLSYVSSDEVKIITPTPAPKPVNGRNKRSKASCPLTSETIAVAGPVARRTRLPRTASTNSHANCQTTTTTTKPSQGSTSIVALKKENAALVKEVRKLRVEVELAEAKVELAGIEKKVAMEMLGHEGGNQAAWRKWKVEVDVGREKVAQLGEMVKALSK